MRERGINFYRILKSDRISSSCFGLFIGSLGLLLFIIIIIKINGSFLMPKSGYLTEKDIPLMIYISLVLIIPNLIGLFLRFLYFKILLKNSFPIKGIVENIIIDNFQFRTIEIKIIYEHLGIVYHGEKMIMNGRIPQNIKKGKEVNVLINKKKPKQFLITDLY